MNIYEKVGLWKLQNYKITKLQNYKITKLQKWFYMFSQIAEKLLGLIWAVLKTKVDQQLLKNSSTFTIIITSKFKYHYR